MKLTALFLPFALLATNASAENVRYYDRDISSAEFSKYCASGKELGVLDDLSEFGKISVVNCGEEKVEVWGCNRMRYFAQTLPLMFEKMTVDQESKQRIKRYEKATENGFVKFCGMS